MIPLVNSRPRDYGLSKASSARLRYFFHAEQFTGTDGAIASNFPSTGNLLNASQANAPAIAVTGWNGQRSLNCAGNKYLQCDAFASAVTDVGIDVCVVMALTVPTFTGFSLLEAVNSSVTTAGWAIYTDANPRLYLDSDAGAASDVAGSSMAALNGVPCIFGMSRRSGTFTIKALTAGGETTYANALAQAASGAVTLQRAAIGAGPVAGQPTGYGGPSQAQIRACGVWLGGGAVSDATLTSLLVYFRDKLGCTL